MPAREGFAIVAIPLLVAAIVLLPAWAFLAVLAAAVLLAANELLTMVRAAGHPVGRALPLLLLALALGAGWLGGGRAFLIVLGAAVIVLPTAQLAHATRPSGAVVGVAAAVLAVAYLGFTGACLGWLRQLPGDAWGPRLILFFLATIWVGDSGAYYVGRSFGRHKMAPRISPNKTWEGLAGGVVVTFLGAAVAKAALGLPLAWSHTLVLAVLLAAAAPIGDLVESQFKRDLGVKDSSLLLPGHGGFLDRTDSLLYAAPWVLGYLLLVGVLP